MTDPKPTAADYEAARAYWDRVAPATDAEVESLATLLARTRADAVREVRELVREHLRSWVPICLNCSRFATHKLDREVGGWALCDAHAKDRKRVTELWCDGRIPLVRWLEKTEGM